MMRTIRKVLYRTLPLGGYLRTVSRGFFLCHALGLGRRSEAMEYVYHLPHLVRRGDTAIDIGANLGYYARPLARIAGPEGRVYAVEPMPPVAEVLRRNLRGFANVEILPCALGAEERTIRMGNASVRTSGYMGTGRNFVNESGAAADIEYTAEMRRGSELFAGLERLDFIKCDIEGYETVVMHEMRPLLERFRPTVLIESGGENRPRIAALFSALDYDAFTLDRGREVPLAAQSTKDIIFRPRTKRSCE